MTPPKTFPHILLHPSLDIRNGVVLVGFRYRVDAKKEKVVYVVGARGHIQYVHDKSFTVDNLQYVVDLGQRMLMPLAGRLHPEALSQFIEDYNEGKTGGLVNNRTVFERVRGLVSKYVELETDVDATIVAAWAIGTYFYPIFAALSDTVDALRGTYLIDQADALKRWQNEELLDSLTDSYKRGGGKRRLREQDARGRWRTVERETYGPKAFATIRELPEDLRDRCLVVPLIRSRHNFLAPDEEAEDWRAIRGDLYKLLFHNHDYVASIYELRKREYRESAVITGRAVELWLPIAVLLECLGAIDEVPAVQARFMAQYQFAEYHISAFDEEVAKTVHDLVRMQEQLVLSPGDIAELMDAVVFKEGLDAVQKAADVGRAIRRLNLASEQATRSKRNVRYVFERAKVRRVYANYVQDDSEPPLATTTDNDGFNIDDF